MKKSTLVAFLLLAFSLTKANIVLKNFQAIATPAGARIVWEFATEEHDVTCNLEKSTDGVSFTPLQTIQLASTRQQALHSYTDRNASGQAFYRLRITKTSYQPYISPIVSVKSAQSAASPGNPVVAGLPANSFFGELSLSNDVMAVQLVNISGQSKIKQYVKGTDLERVFKPSFSNLPSGYYVLNIKSLQNEPLVTKCIYKF